jgi:hypothetical protein
MDFIQSSNKQVDKFGPGKHGFSAGNPTAGVLASFFTNVWADNVQQEIINSIEGAGMTVDPTVMTQLWEAICRKAGPRNLVRFLASGNWVVPANVYRVKARIWGGGGGGGGSPGQVLAVTVGLGGARGSGMPTAGGFGGTTSIGSLLVATGGAGGAGAGGGGVAPVTGTAGEGIGGQFNLRGNPTNAGVIVGGTPLGSAGGGTFCTSIVGGFTNGSGNGAGFPGGGGGGAGGTTYAEGADGAAGLAIIEW